VLSGGEATWSEDQLIPIYRNGKLEDVYWTFSYSPVSDESGNVGGVLVVCNETTDKVNNVKKLEETNDQLAFAIEATELGTFDYNPVTHKFSANDRLKEWFGLPLENEIELYHAINAIAETDKTRVTESIQNALIFSSGGQYNIEYIIVHPITKKEIIVHARGRAWFNNERIAFRLNGTLQDITRSKKAERDVIESKEEFEAAIKATVGILWTNNAVGEMEGEQPGWFSLTGQKYEQYHGYGWTSAVHPDDRQPTLEAWNEAVAEQKNFEFEHRVKKKSGEWGIFSIRAIPLLNVDGTIREWVGVHTEITERKKIEQSLKESEQNLRNVILQAPVAMCILRGPQHVIEIANDRMFELWGKDLEEVIAKPMFEGVPESKDQGFEALLANVYKTGETYKANGVPVTLQRKSGIEIVYVDFVIEAFREADGSISGIMAVAIEVTEQVLSRQKIESSEARFRQMADVMPQFVWTGDTQGNLNYYNQAVYDYSGLSYEQIQKDGWLQIVHPNDREENIKLWMHAMQTGEDFIFQHRFKNIDGNYRWQLSRAVPQRDKEGVIQLWIGTSTDIHEQKLFVEELSRQVQERTEDLRGMNAELNLINQEFSYANEQLLRSNEELAQFTYAASHDMQEPLRKVHTFCSFLLDQNAAQLDERGKMYLTKISTSVNRMKSIIEDLLNYSHQTREEQQFKNVDLAKTIEDVEADLELVIQQKKAAIIKDKLPQITAVSTQMNQLFCNLFSNALKFSKPDVPVKIEIKFEYCTGNDLPQVKELRSKEWYIKIIFSDNGIGFEQQQAEQIFSLFKRLHGKSEYEGTGIGLGLCKKIVQNHKGIIWAESEPDNGARFYIVLPV
jgi:PAS domain S-box-containing protein